MNGQQGMVYARGDAVVHSLFTTKIMDRVKLRSTFLPLVTVFVLVNAACFAWKNQLLAHGVDPSVVQGANVLLFLLATLCALMHYRAIKNPNPNAFVRSIMGATVLKLFVLAGAVLVYVYFTGVNKSVPAIVAGMVLYVVYTIFEVAGAFKLNKIKDGSR